MKRPATDHKSAAPIRSARPAVVPSPQTRRPFLKWAGSKVKLVPALRPMLPMAGARLIEPFVGAGAVFVNTAYANNLLCDSNRDLISLYGVLRCQGSKFVQRCQKLFTPENNTELQFYALRQEFNRCADEERRAALFVYLNRHCYNGLCRYNQKGKFNTPFGRYEQPYFPAEEMMLFAAKLKTAGLKCQDFRITLQAAGAGDVVYCDPPYVPLSDTAYFTDYFSGGFRLADQEDLAKYAAEAARRGATVLLSNHDTAITRRLYRLASPIISVMVSRTISCDGENRKKAKELVAVFAGEPKVTANGQQ